MCSGQNYVDSDVRTQILAVSYVESQPQPMPRVRTYVRVLTVASLRTYIRTRTLCTAASIASTVSSLLYCSSNTTAPHIPSLCRYSIPTYVGAYFPYHRNIFSDKGPQLSLEELQAPNPAHFKITLHKSSVL